MACVRRLLQPRQIVEVGKVTGKGNWKRFRGANGEANGEGKGIRAMMRAMSRTGRRTGNRVWRERRENSRGGGWQEGMAWRWSEN